MTRPRKPRPKTIRDGGKTYRLEMYWGGVRATEDDGDRSLDLLIGIRSTRATRALAEYLARAADRREGQR